MEYYLQQKRSKLLMHIKTGVNPKNMMLSEGSYVPRKATHYMTLDTHRVRRAK